MDKILADFFFFLPKLMVSEWEKLPLGFAPPTIRILPFPPSLDGINVQVWPTLTPGALPLGMNEYLLTGKQLQYDQNRLLTLEMQHLILIHLPYSFFRFIQRVKYWKKLHGCKRFEDPVLSFFHTSLAGERFAIAN